MLVPLPDVYGRVHFGAWCRCRVRSRVLLRDRRDMSMAMYVFELGRWCAAECRCRMCMAAWRLGAGAAVGCCCLHVYGSARLGA